MRTTRTRSALLLVLLSLQATAQEQSGIDRAKASFKAGAAAYAAGDYLAAIQALDAAYSLTPLPAIAFSLAQAERRQYFVAHEREHLDRAVMLFRRYVDELPNGGRRADALDALSQLEPLAATLGHPGPPVKGDDADRRTRLMVVSDAPGARIALDAEPPVASPLIREVAPGKHHARVDAVGFHSTEREIVAIAGELMFTEANLVERPSTLTVWTRRDAELYVDGVFVGTGGVGVTLELPSGSHRLAVAEEGHRVAYRTLALERGKGATVRVALEPTAQRTASRLLFIGGGAALGVGLVLSAFAVRAEDRAEDFLGKQAHRNVTAAELSDYHEAIRDRNIYRAVSVGSLVAAGSFFVTGLFLNEFDHPNLREIRGNPNPPAAPAVRVAPLVGARTYGAALDATF
jgi:tetratricopeptide (TPR) repeat protein